MSKVRAIYLMPPADEIRRTSAHSVGAASSTDEDGSPPGTVAASSDEDSRIKSSKLTPRPCAPDAKVPGIRLNEFAFTSSVEFLDVHIAVLRTIQSIHNENLMHGNLGPKDFSIEENAGEITAHLLIPNDHLREEKGYKNDGVKWLSCMIALDKECDYEKFAERTGIAETCQILLDAKEEYTADEVIYYLQSIKAINYFILHPYELDPDLIYLQKEKISFVRKAITSFSLLATLMTHFKNHLHNLFACLDEHFLNNLIKADKDKKDIREFLKSFATPQEWIVFLKCIPRMQAQKLMAHVSFEGEQLNDFVQAVFAMKGIEKGIKFIRDYCCHDAATGQRIILAYNREIYQKRYMQLKVSAEASSCIASLFGSARKKMAYSQALDHLSQHPDTIQHAKQAAGITSKKLSAIADLVQATSARLRR